VVKSERIERYSMQIMTKRDVSIYVVIKVDFKRKSLRDKDAHNALIQSSIHQEDIIIINTYISKNRATKHIKQKLTD
jgi:hypothetical protein